MKIKKIRKSINKEKLEKEIQNMTLQLIAQVENNINEVNEEENEQEFRRIR